MQDLLKVFRRVHGRSNRWVFTLRDQVLGSPYCLCGTSPAPFLDMKKQSKL